MQGIQRLVATAAVSILAACGGSPGAGPSPIAVPPPGTTAAVSPAATTAPPRPIPAWIAPEFHGTLLVLDDAGTVRHWVGGAFHHCVAPEVDRAVVDPILAEMTALSGIPRTEAGPCNVTWTAGPPGHSYANLSGTASAIYSAEVFLYHHDAGTARHEAGHVLGLGHSPRRGDLMYATPARPDFSADELAILAWMYGR